MSRRNSASVLEMPGTPLLDSGPGQETPFATEGEADTTRSGGEDGEVQEEPPPSPGNFDNNLDLAVRRKKRFACTGDNIESVFGSRWRLF